MQWYWTVDCTNAVRNPYISNADNFEEHGSQSWQFASGKVIDNWTGELWVKSTKLELDGDPDDVLQCHLGIPIFSSRLREKLEQVISTEIQYLPLKIFRFDNSEILGFAIANILDVVPALDLKRSDYDLFPDDYFFEADRGMVRGIRKAVLKSEAVKGHDFIRLKEYDVSIYSSARFKKLFEQNGFTGYSFHEVRVV
jgi:hypothetical protein